MNQIVIVIAILAPSVCDGDFYNYNYDYKYEDDIFDRDYNGGSAKQYAALDVLYDDVQSHHYRNVPDVPATGFSTNWYESGRPFWQHHVNKPHPFNIRNARGYGVSMDESIVETTHGKVRAQTKKVKTGNGEEVTVDIFWAIPFAKPPVGDLRFKRPVSAEPWSGILEADGPPKSCMEIADPDPPILPNPSTPFSEDCLYLTIWRPRCQQASHSRDKGKKTQDSKALATMVWIVGGGFMTGSTTSSIYNGAVLSATECIIVTSMNYRLGALGFLFFDIPEAPGNMGLLDMTLALEWVNLNVQNFGGDPDRITLSGFSIGASSVSLFLLSPLTRNLFDRAIMESGASTSFLTMQTSDSALEVAHRFASSVGCTAGGHSEIVTCLKGVDAAILTQQHFTLSHSDDYVMTALVDSHFLYRTPQQHLERGDFKHCPILLGCMADEGTFFMRRFWPQVYSFKSKVPAQITSKDLDSMLTSFLGRFLKSEYIPQVVKDIKDVYQLWRLWGSQDGHRILLNQVLGDTIFACEIRRLAGIFANVLLDVYLYLFEHPHDWTDRAYWVGALHGSDLDFVFGRAAVDSANFSPREAELSKLVMSYWGNFIKFGNPSPSGFKGPTWPKYVPPDPGNYLHFAQSTDVYPAKTENARCVYWQSIPKHYFKT